MRRFILLASLVFSGSAAFAAVAEPAVAGVRQGAHQASPLSAHQAAPLPAKPAASPPGQHDAAPPAKPDKGTAAGKGDAKHEAKPDAKQAATQDAQSEATHGAPSPTKAASKDGAASLSAVVSRINQVVTEHMAKAAAAAPSASPVRGTVARATSSVPKGLVVKRRPDVMLKWDSALTPGTVALRWDDQLRPPGARRADVGIRLVWPVRAP